ncbi:unnamed protein product [Rotaria magnacalcarata]|uniref:Kynureninase n=9 Tax=Rotaria magnacalcarata TaxID=392030 RepID=A0A819DAV2_9BILA|nr:unnamed protein product [Rotaria magnacalcarata]CAF2109165.1 unnamed protein product [Rotaria magnacalcarata]CAF3820734.1 unnamed protein product [Rotaria magnacalcarata]
MVLLKSINKSDFFKLDDGQSPQLFLDRKALQFQSELNTKQFAVSMDDRDPLGYVRQKFYYPKLQTLPNVDKKRVHLSHECIYLCGQSLGLMPVQTFKNMDAFMHDWATLGVYGHFTGSNPWAKCDIPCIPTMSLLVGGQIKEVAVMNQLSSNLHFMMTTFYQPKGERYKILYEDHAFPSDQYAIHSQIKLRGYDPKDAKIVLKARENERCLRTEDILEVLRREGHSIALVMIGGIHYYTGQLFDIETITRVAHEQGCRVGWDLAHAVGNVPLKLHDWQVDFAVWCTYKYLNGGAGCIGGVFVHSNNLKDNQLATLDGWWSNNESTRFAMLDNIDRDTTALGFRVSNPSIHQCAALAASLDIFEEVGIEQIRAKSMIATQYLQHLLQTELADTGLCQFTLLTPLNPQERGAQLSFRPIGITAQQIHDELEKVGVVIDIRDDIIRIAPAPLYNSFTDIFQFVTLLKEAIITLKSICE